MTPAQGLSLSGLDTEGETNWEHDWEHGAEQPAQWDWASEQIPAVSHPEQQPTTQQHESDLSINWTVTTGPKPGLKLKWLSLLS